MTSLENQPIITRKDENERKETINPAAKCTKTTHEVAVIGKSDDNLSAVTILKEPTNSRASSRQNSATSYQKKLIKSRISSNSSSIPLAVKVLSVNKMKTQANINNRPLSSSPKKQGGYGNKLNNTTTTTDKHTMEAQFKNNKKRLMKMQEELIEKQLPLIDAYKNLIKKKKLLEKIGKHVNVGEIKCLSINYDKDPLKSMDLIEKLQKNTSGGDNEENTTTNELIFNIKYSMDNLTNSVTNLYTNFYSKLIKINPEFDDNFKIKEEGLELKKSLELTINENEENLMSLINSYLTMINTSNINHEENTKLSGLIKELEEKIKKQEQIITDLNRTIGISNKKFDKEKFEQEQTISDLQNKISTLEQDLRKEKKTVYEQNTKSKADNNKIHSLKDKITELQSQKVDVDSKYLEAVASLREFEEQMRIKESYWMKEKNDKDIIIQKLTEQKKQFDTRSMELEQVTLEKEKTLTKKLATSEIELELIKNELVQEKHEKLEIYQEKIKLENELKKINESNETFNELKKKLKNSEEKVSSQNEEIVKMKDSLTAYARLVAVLKVDGDSSSKHVNELRKSLEEAKNEIEQKTKILNTLKEKFATKEAAYDELKNKVKKLRNTLPLANERLFKLQDLIGGSGGGGSGGGGGNSNEHQQKTKVIKSKADFQSLYEGCMMSSLSSSDECLTTTQLKTLPKIGKLNRNDSKCSTRTDSLITMSIKKFNCLRTRMNNLNKITLPNNEQFLKEYYLYEIGDDNSQCIDKIDNIKNQIEFKMKLYRLLQKQADDCYDDVSKLIKLTILENCQENQQQILENTNTELNRFEKSNITMIQSFNHSTIIKNKTVQL